MHRRLQSGMRENPASHRRHGSRSEFDGFLSESILSSNHAPLSDGENNAATPRAATDGERGDVAARSTAIVERPLAARPSHFEPLIGSCDAARLLGSIHVKTLLRYARQRRIPGYQIGGHWYFRASDLDSWLRSRINLSCHPCRSKSEAK
jgi:excisionase family DNA binding protein